MVPDRHGATAWKRWIFCLTDHLNFENLENRRRYQNPGKPRTAGLCGREVVASDHLPLSCTFFRLAEIAGFDPQNLRCGTASHVVFPLEIPSQNLFANLRPHRPHTARSIPKAHGYHPLRQSLTQPLQGLNVAVFTALYFTGLERPPQNVEAVFLALTAPYLMPSLRQTLFRVRRYTP